VPINKIDEVLILDTKLEMSCIGKYRTSSMRIVLSMTTLIEFEDHFIWLRNDSSPPIDVIKFGKVDPDKSKALHTYGMTAVGRSSETRLRLYPRIARL
jgi:hypothetical protein